VLRRTLQRSPTLSLAEGWERTEARLPRSVRSELGRRRRRLEERGRVTFEIATSARAEELEPLLAQGFEVETSGWKAERGTAIGSEVHLSGFYSDVARWAAARGWLRLAFLRLDGRALAFDFCLEHGDTHWLVKTGYDPAFRAFAPGKLLRREMIARAFREGLATYEMLGTDEPWKLEWTSATRSRELVQAFAPSLAGSLDHTWFAHGRPLAKQLRDFARQVGRRASSSGRAPEPAPEALPTRAPE
jgi:CelD/BcsL family acetyltransferase involved in cellulose biosynthesis